MSDFDQLMKDMKQGLNELAEDAQKKYGELINYLDSHNADEIKNDLKVFADKAAAETKEQFENAKKEIKDLSANDSAEKIEEDVNKELRKGCEGMVDHILKKYREDPEKFSFDKALVDEALGKNLNTGKHSRIVNPLLKAYAEVLKTAGPQIMQGIAAATDEKAAAAAMKKAQEDAQKQAAPELLKMLPPELGLVRTWPELLHSS